MDTFPDVSDLISQMCAVVDTGKSLSSRERHTPETADKKVSTFALSNNTHTPSEAQND